MTLHQNGPKSHTFRMTFKRIVTGPGFRLRFILQHPGWLWVKFSGSDDHDFCGSDAGGSSHTESYAAGAPT